MCLDLRNGTLQEKKHYWELLLSSKEHVTQGTPGDKANVPQGTEVSQPPCE